MPEPHCLSRAESKDISKMVTQQKLDSCHVNVTSYEDHAVCVGNGIHVATHAAIGRTLGYIPGSVNDPVFFMHHSFIDWEWMRWQREDEKRWEAGEFLLRLFKLRS
jgi:tyrosinase